jgi:hypothetical protein
LNAPPCQRDIEGCYILRQIQPQIEGHMDELTGRLEVLFRRYAAAFESRSGLIALDEKMGEQFRDDMTVLIAQFGQAAVDMALEAMPNDASPSFSMH